MVPDDIRFWTQRHSESMVMTSDTTNNSTLPKSANHYFDSITGQEFITDVVQYLDETLSRQNTYGFTIERYNNEYTLGIIQGQPARRVKFAAGEEERFIEYLTKCHHLMENKYRLNPIPVERLSSPDNYFHLTILKRTKRDFDYFVEEGSLSKEAATFIQNAYSAGVNILICGATGAAKTTFMNFLADSCKDYKSTILIHDIAEMSFGNDHREITELIANSCGPLLQTAIVLKPQRVLADGIYEDRTGDLNKVVDAGIQIVNTTHLTPEANATGKPDQYTERFPENPFELRIDLQMKKKENPEPGKNSRMLDVVGVHQLIEVPNSKGAKEVRTLFSSTSKIAEPTRTLRRKIEAGIKAVEDSFYSSSPTIEPTRAYVSISEEEKVELLEDCEVLKAHLKNHKGFKERFEKIAALVSKF